jgi:hypothetical protein
VQYVRLNQQYVRLNQREGKKPDEINDVINKEIDEDKINDEIVKKEIVQELPGLQLYISEMTKKLKQM